MCVCVCRTALQNNPKSVPILVNLALCYKHKEDYHEALSYLEKAQKLKINEPYISVNIGALGIHR